MPWWQPKLQRIRISTCLHTTDKVSPAPGEANLCHKQVSMLHLKIWPFQSLYFTPQAWMVYNDFLRRWRQSPTLRTSQIADQRWIIPYQLPTRPGQKQFRRRMEDTVS